MVAPSSALLMACCSVWHGESAEVPQEDESEPAPLTRASTDRRRHAPRKGRNDTNPMSISIMHYQDTCRYAGCGDAGAARGTLGLNIDKTSCLS